MQLAPAMVMFQSAPPARGATLDPSGGCRGAMFQSAPPVRGATSIREFPSPSPTCFNPRPPRGGRPRGGRPPNRGKVSIRAPRAGGDEAIAAGRRHSGLFQSAPPARGATRGCRNEIASSVSIRAPARGRLTTVLRSCSRTGFNPRPPREGRRPAVQSSPPRSVSIRAPRARGD